MTHPLLLSFFKVSQTLLYLFFCAFANLPKKKMDLVIANIPSNLLVPYVSNLTFLSHLRIRLSTTLLTPSFYFLTIFCPKMELCCFSTLMTCVSCRRSDPSWKTIFQRFGWSGLWSIVFSKQTTRTTYWRYSFFYVFISVSFLSFHSNMVTLGSPSNSCEQGYIVGQAFEF